MMQGVQALSEIAASFAQWINRLGGGLTMDMVSVPPFGSAMSEAGAFRAVMLGSSHRHHCTWPAAD